MTILFGCILGSGIGGVEWFEDNCNAFTAAGGGYNSLRMVDPFLIPALIANTASDMIAIKHKAKGPTIVSQQHVPLEPTPLALH